MAIIDRELRVTIKARAAKGQSHRVIARQLGLCAGGVRYHFRRLTANAVAGRSRQRRQVVANRAAIEQWVAGHGDLANLAALNDWLVVEHDYGGGLRSVERFVGEAYPPPPRRARRRIETPPGTQARADCATYPWMIVAGEMVMRHVFHLVKRRTRAASRFLGGGPTPATLRGLSQRDLINIGGKDEGNGRSSAQKEYQVYELNN